MFRGLIGVLLVLGSLFGPLAAAWSLPDPTWIGGMYDAGDSDELLMLVWERSPGVVTTTLVFAAPRSTTSEPELSARPFVPVVVVASASRAPPHS